MPKSLELVRASAPTRIDLAGGTLDIWPLYLFLDQPKTVNLAIELKAEANVFVMEPDKKTRPGIYFETKDQKRKAFVPWDKLDAHLAHPHLEIPLKLIRFFLPYRLALFPDTQKLVVKLETFARSPAGAGLGGSSALCVAILGALAKWALGNSYKNWDHERFIEIVRDIESTVIQVPAGLQDYYGALYGGLQSISWHPGKHSRLRFPVSTLRGLEKRLFLFYSGASRNSGINNWLLYKGFIDKDEKVRRHFSEIARAATGLESALQKENWQDAGSMIADEWSVRRKLAKGITTSAIDEAFRRAKEIGATAWKICGAGGGGCFFIYHQNPPKDFSEKLSRALRAIDGVKKLEFSACASGLSFHG